MTYFDQRVVVVTGAGAGIGRELAVQLGHGGARLALADIDLGAVEETAALCSLSGRDVLASAVDVADRSEVEHFASAVHEHFGRVDAVVNNAGVLHAGDVLVTDHSALHHVMDVDFWGVVNGTKAFLPYVMASDRGHVVNISSAFGLMAAPGYAAYNSAKFAVRGFTEALRQEMELDRSSVKVTCVYPGGVRTTIARTARTSEGVDADDVVTTFETQIARTDAAEAARAILSGVERGRARVLVGADARVVDVVTRVLGSGYQRLLPAARRLRRGRS